jgi:HTH-type transcriptional regulator / antitoxin HigA
LQQLCSNAGVIMLFTPTLFNVTLTGSSRWIGENPLIQLTARYDQNNRFWFTFFHELGHIILHGKKYISLENVDFAAADPVKEQEAHDFAIKHTFAREQEEKLLSELPMSITEEQIVEYAKKFNTHPAMMIGRLQDRGLIKGSVGQEFLQPLDLSSENEHK